MVNEGSHSHPYLPKYLRNEITVHINPPVNNQHTCNIRRGMQVTQATRQPSTEQLTVGQPITTNVLPVETPIEFVACTSAKTFAEHLKQAHSH
jgi:hypothetical protein